MTEKTGIKDQLVNYLQYLQELGVDGLELSENPFFNFKTNVRRSGVRPSVRKTIPKLSRTPEKETHSSQPRSVLTLDTSEILELTKTTLNNDLDYVREKVNRIQGGDAVEVLTNLYRAFHDCQACRLHKGRNKFVFGEGPPDARLMFVGEGPGYDENQQGRPFVGRAGQLLDRIIKAMGYERKDIFISNVVKCRPPGNRNPRPDEMRLCGSMLEKQVDTIQPKVIVALGKISLSYFMGRDVSIMRLRGTFFEWRGIQIMPTYHPAYVLRNPASKRDVWNDMQAVMRFLDSKSEST
ncbi:MAG: hypothetical protein CSA81_05330 [Acidobacteria bacterium]|nr:MAG: hypothetical protein CSA81_05330 [Acidobacteriota bacterium]PIE90990.1 MAG: hypothetical protein CR997_03780 [Acidobacteriota bacterium]